MLSEARRVFFFFHLTYAHKKCRMKEKEMRSESSRRQVQKEGGRWGIILHGLRREGLKMRMHWNEMDQKKNEKKKKNNTSRMAEEDSCALPGKRMETLHRGSSTSTLVSHWQRLQEWDRHKTEWPHVAFIANHGQHSHKGEREIKKKERQINKKEKGREGDRSLRKRTFARNCIAVN